MAREFARAFYHSTAWRIAREAYVSHRMAIDGGMCEYCGEKPGEEVHHKIFLRPENIGDQTVTLDPSNFAYICAECHKRAHNAARLLALRNAQLRDRKTPMQHHGYYFDEAGGIQPVKVVIVWGSPASGKTTYVREHKDPQDVVVDLDLLGRAVCMAGKTDIPVNALRLAYDMRDMIYGRIAARTLDCKAVWVVAGLPKREQREKLREKLGADDLVYIPSTFEECYRRALHDAEREDKDIQLGIIDKWWRDYEPDAPLFDGENRA